MARSVYGQLNQANIGASITDFLEEIVKDRTTEYSQKTSDMNTLVRLANTQEGLDSALTAFKQFDKSNDNWGGQWDEAGDIIGASLKLKRNELAKYQTALKQAQEYYDSGILDKEKVLSYDIDDFGDLSREVRKMGEINDIIASGNQKFKYSISGGQTNEMLKRDMDSRLLKIESTMKGLAVTGKIPQELVEVILMGENPIPIVNQNRSRIKSEILKNKSRLDFAHRILAKSSQAGGQPVPVLALEDGTYTDAEGNKQGTNFYAMYEQMTGKKSSNYDIETIKNWIPQFEEAHTQLNNEYLKWSRSKYNTDIDVDKLVGEYNPSKDSETFDAPYVRSDAPSYSGEPSKNVNALGPIDSTKVQQTIKKFESEDDMKKQLTGGRTSKENLDTILTEVTGKNLNELKASVADKDKSFSIFGRIFNDPVVKEQLAKDRRIFESSKKTYYDAKLNKKVKSAENYFSESLWKVMTKDNKAKYKKLSTFKDSFRKEMKRQYENHVKDAGYSDTYVTWLKEQIESSGLYVPIGIGGKWNQ